MIVTIDWPGVTVSVNDTRGEHWSKTRKRRAKLKDDLYWLLLKERLPACTKIHATAQMFFRTAVRRDEGNFRAELEKALGDILVEKAWLPDDTPEHFTFGELTFGKDFPQHTLITMEVTPA